MVFEYAGFKGSFDGMDPTVITEIAEYISKETNYIIPPMTPFIGKNFNTTKAGIHADGLMKDEEIYNIFDTSALLNRPPLVTISSTSGAAGIAYWLNNYYKFPKNKELSKTDPLVVFIKNWVDNEYANGRVTFISDDEVEKLVKQFNENNQN